MSPDFCQVKVVHEKRVENAHNHLPSPEKLVELAAIFKLLGDPTRLKVLLALHQEELCVCDLAALLESTPSAISHQLRLLRTAGLVHYRKEGKMVYYTLRNQHVRALLEQGLRYLEVRNG